jgi:ABC-2 type transport system ATP-binding protein
VNPAGAATPAGAAPDGAGDAVVVDALTRRFGAVTAVDALSFRVRPGELFGLVGPDGAGKTTTLRMLAGVLKPSSGDANVFGRSVVRDPEGVKAEIAYMSQRFGLYTDLTVAENLAFYADLYEVAESERPARLERLYRFSNLAPFKDRLAGQLSGGMKQKLGLSCALIHEPRLLLLDEPTFGVDPVSRRDLWIIVHEMVARGVTAIVSTAYMDEAERFDRLVLLHQGRVVALDTPESLQHELAGRLVGVRVDRTREAREAALALAGVSMAAVFGDRLHLTVDDATRRAPSIASGLRAAGFEAGEVEPIEPSLEDVFIARLTSSAPAPPPPPPAAGATP